MVIYYDELSYHLSSREIKKSIRTDSWKLADRKANKKQKKEKKNFKKERETRRGKQQYNICFI